MPSLIERAKNVARALGIRRPRNKIPREALETPWMREVQWAQDEVARHAPHPQYLGAYRSEEILYWLPLARWLWGDARLFPGGRGLDIGCAYGTLATYAKRLHASEQHCIDAIDVYISPKLIEAHGLRFKTASIELDPIPFDGPFDYVLFTEVIEHLNFHPLPTLEKIRDALAPDGRLYLSTPDAKSWGRVTKYYRSYEQMPRPTPDVDRSKWIDAHIYQFDDGELRTLFRQAGFTVDRFGTSPGVFRRHVNYVLKRA